MWGNVLSSSSAAQQLSKSLQPPEARSPSVVRASLPPAAQDLSFGTLPASTGPYFTQDFFIFCFSPFYS